MQTEFAAHARPPISLIDVEADALFELALSWPDQTLMGAGLLIEELERAETFHQCSVPPHVATMMSHVVFVDERSGEQREVQLVYPKDADMEMDRVSVLAPIGAALIGMPKGASIEWPNRAGEYRRLRIIDVRQPSRR